MTNEFTELLDQIAATSERMNSLVDDVKLAESASKSGGDWRHVEEPSRLRYRLNELGMNNEVSQALAANNEEEPLNLLERIIDRNNLMPVNYLYKGAKIARAIGRVNIRYRFTNGGFGTGFMVSDRLMMTNHHVLPSQHTAKYSLLEMNFRETDDGYSDSQFFRLKPSEFFIANKELDFALVAVEQVNRKGNRIADFGHCELIRESGKALVGEHINIIQHPAGGPKKIAIRQNKITALKNNFLHYTTDTKQGSSGSGAFNDNWQLVALHHSGVPKQKGNDYLLIDGSIWDKSKQTVHLIHWIANEGVRISKILEYIDNARPGMRNSETALYEQIFESSPGEESKTATQFNNATSQAQLVTEQDGSNSMLLRVNVANLTDSDSPVKNNASANNGTAVNTDSAPNDNIVDVRTIDSEYYNADVDQQAVEQYYTSVDSDSDDRDTLFNQLSQLVISSHKTKLNYRAARLEHLYPNVDRHEFGKLRNIYSGTVLDPSEVIREELEMLETFNSEFMKIYENSALNTETLIEEALDDLESQLPFNCEHVVPQSWFRKRNPMKSDLHHLFTCEPGCNSFRSNIPYWEFDVLDEAERSDCGRRESNKFEPENGHGAVARATLYFLLRYPDMVGDEARELQKSRLNILLNWHERYPVTLYELHRNAEIAKIQGNRNPLIDMPQLAKKINFNLGFG